MQVLLTNTKDKFLEKIKKYLTKTVCNKFFVDKLRPMSLLETKIVQNKEDIEKLK